jgi:hypothetical protein
MEGRTYNPRGRDELVSSITLHKMYGSKFSRTRIADRRSELDELAVQCARIQACAFAAMATTRLPRELRDLVYDLLWDSRLVAGVD